MVKKSRTQSKPGYIPVAGLDYSPEHIARIDDVVRRHHAGESQVAALVGAGFSSAYLELFRSPVFQERLRVWTARLEAEYLDMRATVFHESLALARNPETPAHVRERHYRTLGKWCGMEHGPPQLPHKPGQSDTVEGKSGGESTNEPIDADFDTMRKALEQPRPGEPGTMPADQP